MRIWCPFLLALLQTHSAAHQLFGRRHILWKRVKEKFFKRNSCLLMRSSEKISVHENYVWSFKVLSILYFFFFLMLVRFICMLCITLILHPCNNVLLLTDIWGKGIHCCQEHHHNLRKITETSPLGGQKCILLHTSNSHSPPLTSVIC